MSKKRETPMDLMKEFFFQHGIEWTYVDTLFWEPLGLEGKFIFTPLYLAFMGWYSEQQVEGRNTSAFLKRFRSVFPNGVS